jgi:squalene cyclase
VLALGTERDEAARTHRQRALATLVRGQGKDGGWGPYPTVSAEVFDTALVVLALAVLRADADLAASAYSGEELSRAISRGREYVLRSQLTDGSWPETTRPTNQESYAQRISTTGWALLALIESR